MSSIEKVRQKLIGLSDQDYDLEVYDYLIDLYFLKKPLNAKQRQVLATHILEMEVNNGGFDQFYLNNELKFINDAIAGLKQFASKEFVDMATESKEIYLRDKEENREGRNHEFDKLDEQFYAAPHYMDERILFVQKNIEEIIK